MLPAIKDAKYPRETQSQMKVFSHHQQQSLKFKSAQEKLPLIATKFKQIDYDLNMDYKLKEAQIIQNKINKKKQNFKKIHQQYQKARNYLLKVKRQYAPQIQRLKQQIYENNKKKRALLKNKKDLIEKNKEKPSNDAQFQIQQLQAEIDYLSNNTADKQHQLALLQTDISTAEINQQRLRRQMNRTGETIQNQIKQLFIIQGNKISKYNH